MTEDPDKIVQVELRVSPLRPEEEVLRRVQEEDGAKTYIGDGVYASFDGWHIWLHTERETGWHRIALEAAVFFDLIEYAKRIWPAPKDDTRERMLQDRHEGD